MNTKTSYYLLILCIFSLYGCKSSESESKKRPNILFCIADDATFHHMSAYGCKWVNTPAFDRVANEGLLFKNAYTPNAKCAPSRSCILTGRNSWQLEEAGNHWCFFPTKFKTYAEELIDNGYHTGLTAKGLAPVIAKTADGKKRDVLGKKYNKLKTTPPTKAISNIDYAENFREFLNDKPADKPFCFWYGSTEPHRGYEFGSGVAKAGKKLTDIPNVYSFWPDKNSVRNDMLDYALELEYFDFHLGKMLKILEEKGELDNTLIVVTSDNGMPFPRVKGQAYEYSNHLPLAIMWKDGIKSPGRVINDFVSFIDFAPTFLELAGVKSESSQMQPIEGKSLTDLFYSPNGSNLKRDHVLIGKERHDVGRPQDKGYPIRGIRKGDYLFVINFKTDRWPSGNPQTGYLNCDGGATKSQILNDRRSEGSTKYWDLCFGKRANKELYNITQDPDCIHNLIDIKEYNNIAKSMEKQLILELKEQKDPRMLGNGDIFESYNYANKRDRNFYSRHMSGEETRAGWVNRSDFESKEDMKEILGE